MNYQHNWIRNNQGILKVVIIGIGGIGSGLVEPLTRLLLYRVPELLIPDPEILQRIRLTLVDGDKTEPRNRQRQFLLFPGNKAEGKATEIRTAFPDPNLQICKEPTYLDEQNSKSFISEGDIVFVCPDNHLARRIAISRGSSLDNSVIISAGNDLTDGAAQIQIKLEGEPVTPSILDYRVAIANASDQLDTEADHCGEQHMVTNRLAAMSGVLLLNAMFNAWTDGRRSPAVHEILFDVLQAKMTPRFHA